MSRDNLTLGQRLRRMRAGAKLTQLQLAERLGHTQPFVSKLELDQSEAFFSTVERWASVCGWRVSIEPAATPATLDELVRDIERLDWSEL